MQIILLINKLKADPRPTSRVCVSEISYSTLPHLLSLKGIGLVATQDEELTVTQEFGDLR